MRATLRATLRVPSRVTIYKGSTIQRAVPSRVTIVWLYNYFRGPEWLEQDIGWFQATFSAQYKGTLNGFYC